MSALKLAVYVPSLVVLLCVSWYERKLEMDLTDDAVRRGQSETDLSTIGDFSERLRRQRALERLPREGRQRLRTLASFRLLLALLFVVEVCILQQ